MGILRKGKGFFWITALLIFILPISITAEELSFIYRVDSLSVAVDKGIDRETQTIILDDGEIVLTDGLSFEEVKLLILNNDVNIRKASLDLENAQSQFKNIKDLKDLEPTSKRPYRDSSGNFILLEDQDQKLQMEISKEIVYYQVENGVKLAEKRINLEKQNLNHKVTDFLITYSEASEGINLAKVNLERSRKYVEMTKKQFEKGLIIKSSVSDSEVALSQAENGLKGAEIQYKVARENILSAIGLEDSEALAIDLFKPEVTTTKIDESSMDYVLDFAFKHRLDYLMQEDNMNYEKKRYEIYNDHYTYYGNQQDKIREQEIVYEKEKLNLIQLQRDLRSQVYQVILGFNNALEQLESLQKNVDKAKESLRIAELRYDAGMGTLIEVLNAQVGLTQAENQSLDGKYQIMTMKNNLEKTIGGTTEEYQNYINSLEEEKQ